MIRFAVLLLAFLLVGPPPIEAQAPAAARVRTETLALVDRIRQRSVPVVVYTEASSEPGRTLRPAIISHGYGGSNTGYSFIANHLAAHGYYVASIQQQAPGDEPLPTTGNPYDVRRPSWEVGVRNILFVIDELKRRRRDLDFGQLVLIGHSHGGDTSMLFATEHPSRVRAVISLDSRRMPFPRKKQPRILSLRSSDQPADDGVLPSPEEQLRLAMTIVKLPATTHNDMWDAGTDAQKAEILRYIDQFLREPN
jgi:predicted dienelactone hydrolase